MQLMYKVFIEFIICTFSVLKTHDINLTVILLYEKTFLHVRLNNQPVQNL